MKRIVVIFIAMVMVISLPACTTLQKREPGVYTFAKTGDKNKLAGTSKLMNIIDGFPADYRDQCVLIQGKLLYLFGEPLYESADLEDQYTYVIEVTDETGETGCLTVYHGPSGPAIGSAASDDRIIDAARALIQEINAGEPVDFTYEGYYPDGPSRVWMGIKGGEPYYIEELITDPDEIAAMRNELYPG